MAQFVGQLCVNPRIGGLSPGSSKTLNSEPLVL